ncbi:MAG: class I SAM-dependent methyltransferase [Dokdonella sp.]
MQGGQEPRRFSERTALAALIVRHRRTGQLDRLANLHRSFWSGRSATRFHEHTNHRFDTVFRKRHYPIVAQLQALIGESGIDTLCEIGGGSGQVLEHLAECMPNLRRLIGIDLSADQVAGNRVRNRDPRCEFICADALNWAAANASGGWAWFCYGGVLEFLPQRRLADSLRACAAKPPALFALVEPLADDFDCDCEIVSRHFGLELTSSHPYSKMLIDAGFSEVWRMETRSLGYRWLLSIARCSRVAGAPVAGNQASVS